MFTLTVHTHFDDVKSWGFIEEAYAVTMFEVAIKCVDCEYAELTDAMTGEIVKAWHYTAGILY